MAVVEGISEWTHLPPLTLKGVGEPLVEHAQYYVDRLLWTTGLSQRDMGKLAGGRGRSALAVQVGGGFTGDVWERLLSLERLTGVANVRCGTLWALSEILSINANLYGKQKRRWCPVCYDRWSGGDYEPLVWSIDLMTCCPVHECRMEHACHRCGAFQRTVSHLERRRICSSCGFKLGHEAARFRPPDFLMWVDRQVLELAEYCATPREEPLAWEVYAKFVQDVRLGVRDHRKTPKQLGGQIKRLEKLVRSRSRKPTVRSLINLCALQGISMAEFLNAPVESSGPRLIGDWKGFRCLPLPSAVRARRIYVAIRVLEAFVQSNPPYFPPVTVLLKKLSVPVLGVFDADPKAASAYEMRYRDQGDLMRLKSLRAGYFVAINALGAKGMALRDAADCICDVAGLGCDDVQPLLESASIAKDAMRSEVLARYFDEVPLRSAVEWVVERWSRLAHRV